jgi:predicted metalloprotease
VEKERYEFVKFVVNDVQDTWTAVLPREADTQYPRATLVLFRDAVRSACGFADAASGPFYCPGDQKIYIDLSFYDDLKSRFGAAGDFAQAYVIAHEYGHHVQNVLGIDSQMRRAQQQRPGMANELSVRLELQADCLAGVWGHSTAQRNILESGDVEAGLNAAAAIGDDRIQRMSGRGVHPEKFTHGSSAQRVEWFRRGLESGRIAACDTFGQ